MFKRLAEQDKRRTYPAAPDYRSESTELFASIGELACFALIATCPTVQKMRATGLSFFFGPEAFVWVPGNANSVDHEGSTTATGLFESHATQIHLFVKRNPLENWFDIGKGTLNGIRGSGATRQEFILREINIRLAAKLPETLWLEFGGRSGWTLSVNSEEVETSSTESVLEAVRAAWKLPTVDVHISRYAGDLLFAIADKSGRAAVAYWSDEGAYVSQAAEPSFATDSTYFFPRSDNHDHEVPVEQVISREEALRIIGGVVLTGNPAGLSRLN